MLRSAFRQFSYTQMRTKEDFDKWFSSAGGDPWGYAGDFVQHRLDRSLEFVRECVPSSFQGAFIELGAFNGDFTFRLADAYPSCRVVANDISEVALAQARVKAGGFPNVSFDLSDLAAFRRPPEAADAPIVLLIMEALYYLGRDEQPVALNRLIGELGRPIVFLSGPVRGDDVSDSSINESGLVDLFRIQGYGAPAVRVLNWTDELRTLTSGNTTEEHAETARRLDDDFEFRQLYGRQVMYCFKPA